MSRLAIHPKRAITIWQGWTKKALGWQFCWLWPAEKGASSTKMWLYKLLDVKWLYKLLDVVFTGLKRLFQLSRPHVRCENEERKEEAVCRSTMHVHILLLHSFCSSNYSSLARGRSFGVNVRLLTFLLMFEVAFLLEITMMNFRFCHQNSA